MIVKGVSCIMLNNNQIADVLSKNNFILLGQIEVSESEYKDLVNYVSSRVRIMYMTAIPNADLMLSLALVQIAIRKYQDGKFWPCFEEEIGYSVPSNKLNYIGQIFFKTIKQYNLFIPRVDDGVFQYVEYIKSHAFITNYYMQGFYDFSYAYYENNLFRQLNLEEIEEDFEILSSFMGTTLNNKNDNIVERGLNTASKSYKLLKSTRTTFALCDPETIRELFLPVLKLIDNYFYDGEIPQIAKNRYEEAFIEWCKTQDQDIKNELKNENYVRNRKKYSHKPYIEVEIDEECSYVVIPPQKFRCEDCDGNANVIIEINGYKENRKLDVYKSFGLYVTEEKRIRIPSIFDSINATIKTLSEKFFHIPASNYRIFDRQWKNKNRLDIGYNYILVCHGIQTKWENSQDEIDSYDGYKNWNYFSAEINEKSVFYVGNKPVSIIGEFSIEPIFEKKIERFDVFDRLANKIIASREHPIVSFVVEKEKLNGSVLNVNNIKYSIENIKEKICYDWPEDKRKFAVTLPLNAVLPMKDGHYDVLLDIPGESNRTVCSYLLLKKFDCRFNKPRYTYDKTAILKITNDGYSFDVANQSWELENESGGSFFYTIPLGETPENAELILHLHDEYRITMPIKIFKYGFSLNSMKNHITDYLWYADLKEILYVTIPGAKSVSAYYGKLDMVKMQGTKISEFTFRIDISEFVRYIKDSNKIYHYINLEYEDNAIRKLSLPVIYRATEINPYFKIFSDNDIPYMDVEIKGKSTVYLKVEDMEGNVIFDKKPIVEGRNEFPELSPKEFYNFYPYIEESSVFSFNAKQTSLQPLKEVGCVNLDNLTNCELTVKALIFGEKKLSMNYEYHINLTEREDDITYNGFMFGIKIERISPAGKVYYQKDNSGNFIKKKFGKVSVFVLRVESNITLNIRVYSYQDEDWRSIYYDKDSKELIHFDDELLDSKNIQNRFLFLDEYDADTTFVIDTNRIRKHKER